MPARSTYHSAPDEFPWPIAWGTILLAGLSALRAFGMGYGGIQQGFPSFQIFLLELLHDTA